jgi:uncharacterized protein with WD repeat
MVVVANAKLLVNQLARLLVQLVIKHVKINKSFSFESSLKLLFLMPKSEY